MGKFTQNMYGIKWVKKEKLTSLAREKYWLARW
jgi:hypothetical protein